MIASENKIQIIMLLIWVINPLQWYTVVCVIQNMFFVSKWSNIHDTIGTSITSLNQLCNVDRVTEVLFQHTILFAGNAIFVCTKQTRKRTETFIAWLNLAPSRILWQTSLPSLVVGSLTAWKCFKLLWSLNYSDIGIYVI